MPQADHVANFIGSQIGKSAVMLGTVDQNEAFSGRRQKRGEVIGPNPCLRAWWHPPEAHIGAERTIRCIFASMHSSRRLRHIFVAERIPD